MTTISEEATLPYGSAATFVTTLDHLHAVGIPNVIDRNAMPPSMSGSSRYETLGTFKFFGLIDKGGRPQLQRLEALVNPETRKEQLVALLQGSYAGLFALPLATAGITEVNTWFADHGTPSTASKARSFFVSLAKQNGVAMHSMVAKGTKTVAGGVKRKRKKAAVKIDGSVDRPAAANVREEKRSDVEAALGHSRSVSLLGGAGTVTLSVSIDPMQLDDDDQKFVFDLIRLLKQYETRVPA